MNSQCATAVLLDLVDDRASIVEHDVCNYDARTFAGECQCQAPPDSAAGPGDERDTIESLAVHARRLPGLKTGAPGCR